MSLPKDYKQYTDKYFLRAREVLMKDEKNPTATAQVFIRKGDAKIYGLAEAIDFITKNVQHGSLKIHALQDGDHFDPCEPLMTINGYARAFIEFETVILGIISARTTLENDKQDIDLKQIEENMSKIVKLAGDRPVSYFGARHWSWERDAEIAKACFNAGAANCSTDAGAATVGQKGMGTIPHALQAVYHGMFGMERAVAESTMAFDQTMPEEVPRVALVDYANREIQDSIHTAGVLEDFGTKRLDGIRIDTCGENVIQSGMHMTDKSFWFGRGVTISGVHNVRKALDYSGFDYVKIMLSSGFGNPEKVKAFIDAEKLLKTRLFDGLGVGGVFYSRMATMDVVGVSGKKISKMGRKANPVNRLGRIV